MRLDVGNEAVRKRVLRVTGNGELDQVFGELAVTRNSSRANP